MVADSPSKAPTCFISYSWDSDNHKAWVRKLAEELIRNGVKTTLDQWDLNPGDDRGQFMETSIRESDYVILVCTPNYARKVNAGKGGVAYEKSIVTGEMFNGAPASKFIPVLREGTERDALPSYLGSKYNIDFTNNSDYRQKLEDLLRHLHQKRKYQRPELGPAPFDSDRTKIKTDATTDSIHEGKEMKHQGKQKTEPIDCAYCNGSGKDPNSGLLTTLECEVCHGNGIVRVEVGSVRCRFCRGSGRDPNSGLLQIYVCSNCKGTGRIRV